MSITIKFTFEPWGRFFAKKNQAEISSWLRRIGEASKSAFTGGMGYHPPSSTPGQYPAVRTGRLRGSVGYEVSGMELTVGSNRMRESFNVSIWLRDSGRKMSHAALKEGMRGARLGKWVEWSRS